MSGPQLFLRECNGKKKSGSKQTQWSWAQKKSVKQTEQVEKKKTRFEKNSLRSCIIGFFYQKAPGLVFHALLNRACGMPCLETGVLFAAHFFPKTFFSAALWKVKPNGGEVGFNAKWVSWLPVLHWTFLGTVVATARSGALFPLTKNL